MKKKGFLIKNGHIYNEIIFEDSLSEIKRLLEIDGFIDVATRIIGGEEFDIYIDDEFLLKENVKVATAICKNAHEILMGNLLIVKHDEFGSIKSLDKEQVEKILSNIWFVEKKHVVYNTSCGEFDVEIPNVVLLYEV